ncbi:hypothetical protein ACMXYW_14600 [Neptuniibacter sp. QD48_55]|uniref:hypothetical protein n=1 Tax=unclassified Neptuniibacter TaxID=2630693 RepID=UPI0039F4C72D
MTNKTKNLSDDLDSLRDEANEEVQVIEVSIEEIRAMGGISHLGLDKAVEEDLTRQLIEDGIFQTH